MSRSCPSAAVMHAWRLVLAELRAGGAASAVHLLWLLRRQSSGLWHEFAKEVGNHSLTRQQFRLVASLWELSKEQHIEDIAPRLGEFPVHFCNAFCHD